MWTKRDIIVKAFEELTLAGSVFDLTPAELQSALSLLDTLMAEWLAINIDVGYTIPDGPTYDLDVDSGVVTKHARRVWLNLAVILGAQFGKPVANVTIKGARKGYEELLIGGNVPDEIDMQDAYLSGAGNMQSRGWL
jgi:hypothetical protein